MTNINTIMTTVQYLLSELLPDVHHEHQLDFHWKTSLNTDQQESIPVGCVQPAWRSYPVVSYVGWRVSTHPSEDPCLGGESPLPMSHIWEGVSAHPRGLMFGGGGWVPIPKVQCSGKWVPSHPQTYPPLNIFPPRYTHCLPRDIPSWKGPSTRDTLEKNGTRNAHPSPHCWQTNTCENITFPQLRWRTVKNTSFSVPAEICFYFVK